MDPDIEEGAVSDDAAAQISAAFAAVEEVDNPDDPRHALKEYVPPGSEKPAAEEVEADSPEAKVSPAAEKPASAETPAAKPAEAPAAKVPETDSDLDALAPGKGANKAQQVHFERMRQEIKLARTAAREATKEAERIKADAKALPPDVAERLARLEKLEHLEYIHSPETSARVEREFGPKLKETDSKVRGLMAGWFGKVHNLAPEAAAKMVEERVGADLGKFPPDAWLGDIEANRAAGKLTALEARRLSDAVVSHFDTLDARKEAIAKAPASRKEWEEKSAKAQQEAQAKAFAEAQEEHQKLTAELPDWAKPREIPANATPEQKKEAEAANDYLNKVLEPVYSDALKKIWQGTPRDHVRVAAEAVKAHHFQAENVKLAATVADLEKQLNAALGKVTAVKKAGQVSRAVSAPSSNAPAMDPGLSLEESLAAALDRA